MNDAAKADVALIGLAVMGQNLVLNMCDHDVRVAVYNRSGDVTDTFANGPAAGKSVVPCKTLAELTASLERPRCVMIMVRAGAPVDAVIE